MARVNVNQLRKRVLAHRLAGPHVRRTTNQIVGGARRLAPRGDHTSGSGERRPGVQLVNSFRIDMQSTPMTIREKVAAEKPYATAIHQGSSPHWIRGRGKMLKFTWERGTWLMAARRSGRGNRRRNPRTRNTFYFVRVRHPGNKRPVRYLTTPMHLYGRMNGFRTTSTPARRGFLP